jgi:hypothetical protein
MSYQVGVVIDGDTRTPSLAVIASDTGVSLYYPKDVEKVRTNAWVAEAPQRLGVATPDDAEGWYRLAMFVLAGNYDSTIGPEPVSTPAMAKARAREMITVAGTASRLPVQNRARSAAMAQAFDELVAQNPDAYDAFSDPENPPPPEMMLTLAQLAYPPTRPDDDHEFIPESLDAMDRCNICSMPLDWEAHTNSGTMPNTNHGASGG